MVRDVFALDRYLTRIGHAEPVVPTLETLRRLHAAHAAAIPFEAIDPLLGRPVALDMASLQAKIIDGRRGGYCFEQNALFGAALKAIGFNVTGLGARVRWMSPPDSPLGPREHMLLKVDLTEGTYLADVGFGACVLDAPLQLALDAEQRTAMGTFRLTHADGHYWLQARQGRDWRVMYAFDLVAQLPADYALGNYNTSTSSQAPFGTMLIMERVDAWVRTKLINRRLIVEARDGEVTREHEIADADELDRVLDETFNVRPPEPSALIFARISGDGQG